MRALLVGYNHARRHNGGAEHARHEGAARHAQTLAGEAQRTWAKAHDSAVQEYGAGERAHRVAFAALKHSFEKIGDHWEPKAGQGPSDPRSKQSTADKRRGIGARGSVNQVIEAVSAHLGNTPAVCRASYVHPLVIEAFTNGTLARRWARGPSRDTRWLIAEERRLAALLRARQTRSAKREARSTGRKAS